MKRDATTIHDKPALDEGSFQQLLSAAFVLQQHKEHLQNGNGPEAGYSKPLAEILSIQEDVRTRHLDLQAAASLIARRIREITNASGAAVGIIDGAELEYYAASGRAAGEIGSRVPWNSSLVAECLQTGQIFECLQAENDPRVPPDLCHQLGVKALIAVPIGLEGRVAGVLELHFSHPNSFHELEVNSCQLLAALLGEVMAGTVVGETSTASDPASMLAALEKIRPHLDRLSGNGSAAPPLPPKRASQLEAAAALSPVCSGCGHELAEDELFCGICGTGRLSQSTWASLWEMQRDAEKSGATSLEKNPAASPATTDHLDVLPSELEDIVSQFAHEPLESTLVRRPQNQNADVRTPEAQLPKAQPPKPEPAGVQPPRGQRSDALYVEAPLSDTQHPEAARADVPPALHGSGLLQDRIADNASPYAEDATDKHLPGRKSSSERDELALPSFTTETHAVEDETSDPDFDEKQEHSSQPGSAWTSAATTREWLEDQNQGIWLTRKWQAQRANIYLALSALLLVAVLAGLGAPSAPATPSNPSTAEHKKKGQAPAQPELTPMQKLLVNLGLADAPEVPPDMGNPDTKVWIDVRTALYYCSGSDLYGKTQGGRFTTQSDAQQDQFQSASRRACD